MVEFSLVDPTDNFLIGINYYAGETDTESPEDVYIIELGIFFIKISILFW